MRALLLGTLPLMCIACANEPAPRVLGYQATVQPSVVPQRPPAGAGQSTPEQATPVAPKKNMADKVLAAIALERVTGRKPDPATLIAAW